MSLLGIDMANLPANYKLPSLNTNSSRSPPARCVVGVTETTHPRTDDVGRPSCWYSNAMIHQDVTAGHNVAEVSPSTKKTRSHCTCTLSTRGRRSSMVDVYMRSPRRCQTKAGTPSTLSRYHYRRIQHLRDLPSLLPGAEAHPRTTTCARRSSR